MQLKARIYYINDVHQKYIEILVLKGYKMESQQMGTRELLSFLTNNADRLSTVQALKAKNTLVDLLPTKHETRLKRRMRACIDALTK